MHRLEATRLSLSELVSLFIWALIQVSFSQAHSYAQPFILTSPHEVIGGEFGFSVNGIGDVNLDGFDDVIIGALSETNGPSGDRIGRAYVFSGKTTQLLYSLLSPNPTPSGRFGSVVSQAGHLNSNGIPDIIVGAPTEPSSLGIEFAGRVHVFDGHKGTYLYSLESTNPQVFGGFGRTVAGIGDVNGNGFDDIIVGAWSEDLDESLVNAGRAYLFDGNNGSLLGTLVSPHAQTSGEFGYSVAGIDDINGNGFPDVLIGARFESFEGGQIRVGSAYIFDGNSRAILYALRSSTPTRAGEFGLSVSDAGDIDGDGIGDVIIGADGEGIGGHAHVYSGRDGSQLYLFSIGEVIAEFGTSVAGVGDIDADGFDDVVVGALTVSEAGQAYVYSGQNGSLLFTLKSGNQQSLGLFGSAISGAGDVSGDGIGDVIVGAPFESPGNSPDRAGRAYVFNGSTGTILPVELISFDALIDQSRVLLSWKTTSETNNAGFEIQHRRFINIPDQNWTRIGWIGGAGSTNTPQDYQFRTHDLQAGPHQFRLKQVDLDGAFIYSKTLEVVLGVPGTHSITEVYPNPVSDQSRFTLTVSADQHVSISLIDLTGRVVQKLFDGFLSRGQSQQINIGAETLPSGVYIYKISSDIFTDAGRIVVVK